MSDYYLKLVEAKTGKSVLVRVDHISAVFEEPDDLATVWLQGSASITVTDSVGAIVSDAKLVIL